MAITYMQVHCTTLLPVLVVLYAIYRPVFGRRDGLKVLWLCFMATVWTTPWDNWILHHSGWSYPPGSIWGRIYLVPLEEHLFFLVQSTMLVLLHSIISHPALLPSGVRRYTRSVPPTRPDPPARNREGETEIQKQQPVMIQTLERRPLAASFWLASTLLGALLVHEAHDLRMVPVSLGLGKGAFYLGWILIWISPVLAFLTYLGGRMGREEKLALAVGTAWLWGVDTGGAWSISGDTTLRMHLWRGLPVEEALFFLIVSHLLTLSSSLTSHLHTLQLLCPSLPVCPPRNPIRHIATLFAIALDPPEVDLALLRGLADAEETLRQGSKSFEVAKLAFGREMRIGLVAVYAWCRVTDDLIDNTPPGPAQLHALSIIRHHLLAAFSTSTSTSTSSSSTSAQLNAILDSLPQIPPASRSAFYIFSSLIPRLCPVEPFLELCRGYETDLQFAPAPSPSPSINGISVGSADVIAVAADSVAHGGGAKARAKEEGERAIAMSRPDSGMATTTTSTPISPTRTREAEAGQEAPDGQGQEYALEKHLPIRTTADLMQYADDVAGSIAAAICYLSYSILDSDIPPGSNSSSNSTPTTHGGITGITGTIGPEWLTRRPVEQLRWTRALHGPDGGAAGAGAAEPGYQLPHVGDSEENGDYVADPRTSKRRRTVLAAREMGRALQLVNIARDVAKDATINRLYIPLSHFSSARDILSVLRYSSSSSSLSSSSSSTSTSSSSPSANLNAPAASPSTQPASPALGPPPDYSTYNLPLLALATSMRTHAIAAIDDLPGTARGGTRAMVASYFQIAHAVQRERGRVDERGVRVGKWGRVGAAAWAMWVGR